MISDSNANASIPMASSNAKDLAKKKRVNRSAKLKQCKLDARREQWLSQVKNKGCKEESNGGGGISAPPVHARSQRNQPIKDLEIDSRGDENEGPMHNYSDAESPWNSPTSHASSVLGGNDSGTNFSGSSSSNSSSSSVGCCSGSITEEDDEEDDWEAFADALAATENKQEQHDPNLELPSENGSLVRPDSSQKVISGSGFDISKPKPECRGVVQGGPTCQAWRPDDAFRPQSLPNLSKQHSFPMNSDRHCVRGSSVWGCNKGVSAPKSCPICYEDLDLTDTSFLPCSCGFRLCLFCHKRILEEDGRCPGCRKHYDNRDLVEGEATMDGGSLTFRLARSCSMITRS